MTSLAPLLEAFFVERLQRQRRASSHTVMAYRDAFRLLLAFAETRTGKAPSDLLLADVDASLVGAFLDHLELILDLGQPGDLKALAETQL